MKTILLPILAAFCIAALPLAAANDDDSSKTKSKDRLGLEKAAQNESKAVGDKIWTCIIGNHKTAVTMVKLDAITSVSKQTYMLDGAHRILEVTIDTTGNNSIRFYCMGSERANRAMGNASNARELMDKYSENASHYPAKKYPEGVYSHNVEYQLSSPSQLHTIYESVTNAWVKSSGATLRL